MSNYNVEILYSQIKRLLYLIHNNKINFKNRLLADIHENTEENSSIVNQYVESILTKEEIKLEEYLNYKFLHMYHNIIKRFSPDYYDENFMASLWLDLMGFKFFIEIDFIIKYHNRTNELVNIILDGLVDIYKTNTWVEDIKGYNNDTIKPIYFRDKNMAISVGLQHFNFTISFTKQKVIKEKIGDIEKSFIVDAINPLVEVIEIDKK